MREYCKPLIKVYSLSDLLEILGPTQAASGTVTVYGGGSIAQLDSNTHSEYRLVQANVDYGIVTKKEVSHA